MQVQFIMLKVPVAKAVYVVSVHFFTWSAVISQQHAKIDDNIKENPRLQTLKMLKIYRWQAT